MLKPSAERIAITAEGETFTFKISEQVRRDKHVPTLDELAAEERRKKRSGITLDSTYGREYPEWDFCRTGQLSLEISNEYLSGYRRAWKDGKRQRLEDLIGEIVAGILAYGTGIKLDHEKRERRYRNFERERRVDARAKAREERETARTKILHELVDISAEATKLRAWLVDADRWPVAAEANEFSRFVDWARTRLKYLEQAVNPDGIAQMLRERELYPDADFLADPPEDLVDE